MKRTFDHKEITDPKYRRLRKAMRKAEEFLETTCYLDGRAVGRWNKIRDKAIRVGAMKP